MKLESKLLEKGFKIIAGADEAGRGALAGPLVAAACIMPLKKRINKVDDSKKLTPKIRESLFRLIKDESIDYKVIITGPADIDKNGIQHTNINALQKAIEGLKIKPDYILIDYYDLGFENSLSLVKGESVSYTIACASIIAKVTRDEIMKKYHNEFPEYDFNNNKGYGTSYHINALKVFGPSPIHRITFQRVGQTSLF